MALTNSHNSVVTGSARILFVIDSIWGGGGAETSLLRLIQNLPRERFECTVITFHSDPSAQPFISQFPCPVHHWPMISLYHYSTIGLTLRLRRFVRDQHIDVVHSFFPLSDIWAGPVSKLSGARVLISSRRDMGILRKSWHGIAYRICRPLYDEIHAVSEAVRQFTITTDQVDPGRMRTVYNGVDVSDGGAVDPLFDLPPGRPVVTLVAHMRRVKGIDLFLKAAALVRQTHPEALFLIAGGFGTNAEHIAYHEEVVELNRLLGNHVRFLGEVSRIPQLLQISAVFVLPSRSEGFSNALLEAMVTGLPCIATAVGGTPELVINGVTGFLVPPDDPAALAARISGLLENPALGRRLGAAGKQRALERFSISAMVNHVTASYDSLLSRPAVR